MMAMLGLFGLFFGTLFAVLFLTNLIYVRNGWSPRPWSFLDCLPFNCERCCTTWTLVSAYVMEGFLLNNYIYMTLGLLMTAGWAYGRYIQDEERMQ